MEYRAGKCADCDAQYKIPTSFAHNVARCKECGGTVYIGKVGEPAPDAPAPKAEPMPAKKVAQKEAPKLEEHVPSGKKGDGPSMLDKLRARQAEEAATPAPAPAKKAAAKPAPKPAAGKPAPKAKPAAVTAAAAGGRRSAAKARPGARRRGGKGEEDDEDSGGRKGRRSRYEKKEKKKSPMIGLVSIGLIVILAVAAYFMKDMFTGGSEEPEPENVATTDTPEETPEEVVETPVDEPEPEPDVVDEPEPEPEPEKEPEPEVFDPASVDLTEIEDFAPTMGCTQEKWDEMVEWMNTFMDIDAGAKGNRAGNNLEEEGRIAVPVIINSMKHLDFSTEEGFRLGDMCQKRLERIAMGSNFGWKYAQDDEAVVFNKKVVRSWAKAWEQADESIEAWIKIANLDKKDPKQAAKLREEFADGAAAPAPPEAVIDDDELDVD